MRRAHALTPAPSLLTPELATLVAAVVHEARVLLLSHRSPRDRERRELDLVLPLLVVEHERSIAPRAEQERPACVLAIVRAELLGRFVERRGSRAALRRRRPSVPERLPHRVECLE